jgi:hypothetical protein
MMLEVTKSGQSSRPNYVWKPVMEHLAHRDPASFDPCLHTVDTIQSHTSIA